MDRGGLIDSLDPLSGVFKKRLNRNLGHWPYPTKTSSYCQLCRWAADDSTTGPSPERKPRKFNNVIQCAECNVNLCNGNSCFMMFHSVWDLTQKKQNIRNDSVENP